MTKIEEMSKLITKKYKEDNPDATFVSCVVDVSSSWNFLFFSDEKGGSHKRGKFYVKDISPVLSELSSFSMDMQLKARKLVATERTGLFKITFSDGSFMYAAKWFAGIGRSRVIESMFGAEGSVWVKFLAMTKKVHNRKIKPKLGVYNVRIDNHCLVYDKFGKIPNNAIYHNELSKIKQSVNYYFGHVSDFMKYNQPGRRTLLLYGEPGTSKTSTLYKLALEHKDTKSVVFATDIEALFAHIQMCEKYSVPTIACFEDCEGIFAYNNSEVKSFLSGIHAGRNKAGTCIVYTTNYPERIEASIKERPERIDELFYIGPIEDKLLIDCAKFYFGEFAPSEAELQEVLVKPMAGAEVKLFVENTLRYCASAQKTICVESMAHVLSNYRDDLKKLKKFSKSKGRTFAKELNDDGCGFKSNRELVFANSLREE